jgi:HSP20 family protein
MTIVKQRPVLNHFVNDFFGPFTQELSNFSNAPLTNIHENNEGFHIELVAPGKNKEDFKISVNNGLLTIGYETKEETKQEDYKTIRREFKNTAFTKTFSLEDKVDTEGIAAKYEAGILKVLLPKKEAIKSQPKTISVF